MGVQHTVSGLWQSLSRRDWDAVGKVRLWKVYWDLGGLTAQAPPTWLPDMAAADTSWVFDATGLI